MRRDFNAATGYVLQSCPAALRPPGQNPVTRRDVYRTPRSRSKQSPGTKIRFDYGRPSLPFDGSVWSRILSRTTGLQGNSLLRQVMYT